MRLQHWLVFLLLTTAPWISHASADEWFSREGACSDWKGRWMVGRDQSGVWVGNIDYIHIGGPCSAPDHSQATQEVRAVIVGEDFFARRRSDPGICLLHGRVRGDEVRGHELCDGTAPLDFTLHLTRGEPEGRDREGHDEWREPEPPRR